MYTEGKGQGEGEDLDTSICSKIQFLLNSRISNVYLFLALVSPIIYKFHNFRILEFWNRDTSSNTRSGRYLTQILFQYLFFANKKLCVFFSLCITILNNIVCFFALCLSDLPTISPSPPQRTCCGNQSLCHIIDLHGRSLPRCQNLAVQNIHFNHRIIDRRITALVCTISHRNPSFRFTGRFQPLKVPFSGGREPVLLVWQYILTNILKNFSLKFFYIFYPLC